MQDDSLYIILAVESYNYKNPVSGFEDGSVSLTGSESVIISTDPDPSINKQKN